MSSMDPATKAEIESLVLQLKGAYIGAAAVRGNPGDEWAAPGESAEPVRPAPSPLEQAER